MTEKIQPPILNYLEGRHAPEGYLFSHKRFMKKCKSCLWWKNYSDGRDTHGVSKRKRKACTQVVMEKGRQKLDPVTGITVKGEHYGERTDPLFSCENFKPKTMPLVKIKESKDGS